MTTPAEMDKSIGAVVGEGHGTIAIRVVVLRKTVAAASARNAADNVPVDAAADELLPEVDKRPIATYLEEPKRGRQVCVFLINGQRQHAWDNQFIVRDLELKYLRNRLLVVVDCDGLKPEAIAELMQGTRHQFYDGRVYSALESRVLATLKGDPDLRLLEEEAEDDISSLQAGDEAVKSALDELIESHHVAGARVKHGQIEAGGASRAEGTTGTLTQLQDVVIEGTTGTAATGPVLELRPDIATIRLKPDEDRRLLIQPKPDGAWRDLVSMTLTFDPPVKELRVTRTTQTTGEFAALRFDEPDDFDNDEYPIETTLRAYAMFQGYEEARLLERRVVITPSKKANRKPPVPLKGEPTFLRVTSRQPIKIHLDGPDVHVKLRWDGEDRLAAGNPPEWTFRVSCESPSVEPPCFLTRPSEGRLELLIQAAAGLTDGQQLRFDIEALGPGKTLSTAFLADVVHLPSPRKVSAKLPGGAQRRPPYDLKYLKRSEWDDANLNCFGSPWSGIEAGSFEPPGAKSPLTIFINQDMDLLASYRDLLISKKSAEATIQQRVNKYTAHVAYHLYQMYQKKTQDESQPPEDTEVPTDAAMRDEIRRVARTLLKLMNVG